MAVKKPVGKKPAVKKAPVKKPAVKKVAAKKPAVASSKAKTLAGLEKKIGKVPKFFKELTTKEPEMFNLVMKFEDHIWSDGKLSKKTKKLIAIAIAAALRDQHAVRAQMAGAKNVGCTKAEVEEALRVTFLLSGMPAYVYGRAQLDDVMK
jgi:alkylhydroperoxidase/carboxymuconolactone decarboxylase family protein YurZ